MSRPIGFVHPIRGIALLLGPRYNVGYRHTGGGIILLFVVAIHLYALLFIV
jgi:hypothetical protein